MIIQDSTIHLNSAHTLHEQDSIKERLRLRFRRDASSSTGGTQLEQKGRGPAGRVIERVDLSSGMKKSGPGAELHKITPEPEVHERAEADLNILILRKMIERITGKVIDIRYPQEYEQGETDPVSTGSDLQGGGERQGSGISLEYEYTSNRYEYEATSFAGSGMITTGDGREITFSVDLRMSREFMSSQQISLRAGEALKDPLTVNFAGTAAELSTTRFAFDIDLDGKPDQISLPSSGSGFLALDSNGDGAINDGRELFGPSTGHGFAELAAYDQDGNGWIDGNDDIFDRLRIWSSSADGQQRLFALGQVGVGAIYLHHVSTPFSMKNDSGELLAQVRDSSIFVREDGSAGTIQQIDLVV